MLTCSLSPAMLNTFIVLRTSSTISNTFGCGGSFCRMAASTSSSGCSPSEWFCPTGMSSLSGRTAAGSAPRSIA